MIVLYCKHEYFIFITVILFNNNFISNVYNKHIVNFNELYLTVSF